MHLLFLLRSQAIVHGSCAHRGQSGKEWKCQYYDHSQKQTTTVVLANYFKGKTQAV